MNTKIVFASLIVSSFIFANSASAAVLPSKDIIAPDSPLYFLQIWKESIQTFFTFGAENKAKQYLHLAEVRLDEYQKMVDKGKTEIADKILQKYETQLDNALQKTEELKNKGKDVTELSNRIEQAVSSHLQVLQENLQKVPEQAQKGIENAIGNSQKAVENVLGKKIEEENDTADWKTYRNDKCGFEVKYPVSWHFDDSYKNNNGQEFVTFISSDVFEESSQLMLGIRKKGSNANIGFSTGRGLDEFIQQGTVNIGGTIVKIYYMLGENNTISSVYFNDYGGITEVKNFEIAASLNFMDSPKLNNIEKNLDFQNSKKILESLKFLD